jgi:hypothetical protein
MDDEEMDDEERADEDGAEHAPTQRANTQAIVHDIARNVPIFRPNMPALLFLDGIFIAKS